MDRIARLLSTSTKSDRIIEIGAGYCPVAPKSGGWRTHVVDHADQDALRAKYAQASVDLTAIEDVDTVWQEGSLHDAVPAELHGQFETLIASHVLEHLPDLIGFLGSAEKLLTSSGTISIALPDRRFCFDYFKPMPTTGDLLEAHVNRRTRHSLRTAWNHLAYSVTVKGELAWGQHAVERPAFIDPFAVAMATQATFSDDSSRPYADYHVWPFTPASFSLAMLELGQLGAIDWRVDSMHGPERFEFYAILRRGAQRMADPEMLQQRRMDLLQQQLLELREQIDFAVVGGGLLSTPGRPPPDSDSLHEVFTAIRAQDARLSSLEMSLNLVHAALRPIRAVRRVWLSLHRRMT